MASISAVSVSWSPLVSTRVARLQTPSASLSLLTGSKRIASSSANNKSSTSRSALLHCSFISSSTSSSLAFHSSLSGLSLGLEVSSKVGLGSGKRRGLVVRAGKPALCLTKRNRSRKSLARTHGFRRRMRTTSGRAVLKRRRAKGRKILCTKSYPRSGKGA